MADKNWERAQDLYQHHAIAERDLLQAESDRNQAQADMNAAEQSMKILGITNPEDLEKSPSSAEIPLLAPIGGEVVERLVAPGQVLQAGHDAGVHDFGYEHGVGAGEYLSGDLADVKAGDVVDVTDRRVSRSVPRENFVHFARARSHHANAAGANRGG